MSKPLPAFVPSLVALQTKVADWDTARAEEHDRDAAWAEVVPVGRVLLLKSIDLFEKILKASTMPDEDTELALELSLEELEPSFDLAANSAAPEPRQASQIGDLAFIAKLEARQMLERLDRLVDEPSKWLLLETCQRARRRSLRALTALGKSIQREHGEDASSERFVEELRRSLRCRNALARLWHGVELAKDASALRRLRAAGTAIAVLQGGESYGELRLRDRRALRMLQERLLRWLRDRSRSDTEADRLLQDLKGFVSLTRQISRRSELIEHDRSLIRAVLNQLERCDSASTIDAAFDAAHHLRGLSPQLDALLIAKEPPPLDVFRKCLLALNFEDASNHPRLGSTREFERARDVPRSKQARP